MNDVIRARMLSERTGCGVFACREALAKFNNRSDKAYMYLELKGIAVNRRNPDGSKRTDQEDIDYVNATIK